MTTPTKPPIESSASAVFTTPTKRAAFAASADAGPSRARPAGASPAYSSRRHSLYGIEDRIVIDPGSRIWKVGFSGEAEPRACFWSVGNEGEESGQAWDLDLERVTAGDPEEAARSIGLRVTKNLRSTFQKHLQTDSKARKVIIVENTLLPTHVKDHIAVALFENLRVPSVSFAHSSILALTACGRVTGLVIDCGWLETTLTPVYHSRPLLHLSRSTPIAGRALHDRIRNLVERFGSLILPPTSLNTPRDRQILQPVPSAVLSGKIVERIVAEGCFVPANPLPPTPEGLRTSTNSSPTMEDTNDDWTRIFARYHRSQTSKDLSLKVPSPPGYPGDLGYATLVVPGWVRERAAELLCETDETMEASSIPELALDCLLKLPIDLRAPLAESMLVTGGTAMLPGFISRLRESILAALRSPEPVQPPSPAGMPSRPEKISLWRERQRQRYHALYALRDRVAIINDPLPHTSSGSATGGQAPRWVPSLMSWVGGSLAGALKTGGPELLREEFDSRSSEASMRAEAWQAQQDALQVEAATLGLELEELLPGMALHGLDERRKRGWTEGVRVADWARAVPAG